MRILEFLKINEIHCIYECFLNITLFHWRGSATQNWRSRLRCRAHFFVVAALRGNAISVFVNTSAACACCAGVFVRSALMARVAFDDTSNVIFVVLALMPLKCKRRAYSHTHAYRKYIAFARLVFRSFDFHFLHGTSRTSSPCSWRYYVFLTLGGLGLTTPTPILVKLKCWTHFRVKSYFSCPQLSHN